nr:hypothetical protein [Tanacetum cinerariifolium]
MALMGHYEDYFEGHWEPPSEDESMGSNQFPSKLDAKDVSIANLRKHIETLKGKNVVEKDATPNKAKVISSGMFKLDLEPLSPKILKNRDAHIDYINHTQKNDDILWELVKHARALRPLDNDLDSAFTTDGTRVKTVSESYYCQYKEVTIAHVEVSAA